MSGASCYFFADESDLLELLDSFFALSKYKYVQMRSGVNEENCVPTNAKELLLLSKVSSEKPTRVQSFLVVESDQEVFFREIVLIDGGIRRIADQNNNFDSIVLAFGGDAGDQTLIMSDISTVGDTKKALEIHKNFRKLVESKAVKSGNRGSRYFLMPGAVKKLKSGWRLAGGKEWSRETDPKFSPKEIDSL